MGVDQGKDPVVGAVESGTIASIGWFWVLRCPASLLRYALLWTITLGRGLGLRGSRESEL
jgi:hypothetical protein